MKTVKRNLFNKNAFGKPQPEIFVSDTENSYHLTNYGKIFYVSKEGGKYRIFKRDIWAVYDAIYGKFPFCDKIPPFESMIQAVRFMIDHAMELS